MWVIGIAIACLLCWGEAAKAEMVYRDARHCLFNESCDDGDNAGRKTVWRSVLLYADGVAVALLWCWGRPRRQKEMVYWDASSCLFNESSDDDDKAGRKMVWRSLGVCVGGVAVVLEEAVKSDAALLREVKFKWGACAGAARGLNR